MDQNGNGTPGEATDSFVARATLSGGLSFENTKPAPIRDYRNTISTINVGAGFNVADLNVSVNLDHTYVGDLQITLRSPSGRVVTLFSRRGRDGRNLSNTMFDDEALTGISSGVAPFTGAFRPETPLSAFDGSNARGNWTLTVSDRAWYDTGALNSWKLDFTAMTSAASSRATPRSALRSMASSELALATLAANREAEAGSIGSVSRTGSTIAAKVSVEVAPNAVAATPVSGSTARTGSPKRPGRSQGWFDQALWARI